MAAFLALLSPCCFAQDPSIDSAVVNLDSAAIAAFAEVTSDSTLVQPPADSAATADSSGSRIKAVLYLGGGERSPWFHLGVLYAIEEYGIPVDSIVGTSWGAWIGFLWAKGVPLDEIQKLMLDPIIAPFVGHDLSLPGNNLGVERGDMFELPISLDGVPSFRQRFTLSVDSSGRVMRSKRRLSPDSMTVKRTLAKLKFQESLYRQRITNSIPFVVQGCEGKVSGNRPADVIASLPLWIENPNGSDIVSGELCPYYAIPVEDNMAELPIIVVADPLRKTPTGDVRSRLLKRLAASGLANQPGAIIRAHTSQDTSRTAWIQLGFSTLEQHLSDFALLKGLRVSYDSVFTDRKPRTTWFRFAPTFDSLSSETHSSIKSYWSESDTGFAGPRHFAESLSRQVAYDSVSFDMQPSGDLMVNAAVHPTFDVAVGGFGSNVIGANAYFEGTVNYVNQMEIQLMLAGFWGTSSYGVQPRLNISKLWSKQWGVQFGFDYLMLRPLKSFNNEIDRDIRIESEERSDFMMSLVYQVDARQKASLNFLFGHHVFEMDPLWKLPDGIKTYPVTPTLRYEFLQGDQDSWFVLNGFAVSAQAGLESIGFDFGMNDLIPIYWKLSLDARYAVSPRPFATFTLGISGGMERYHDEGHGYVYPKSFEYRPMDLVYRYHVQATPWSREWYNPELATHEYGLIRAGAGLHGRHLGLWLFAAYYHDFEESPLARLEPNKFILEPALRFAYRSFEVYAGMNRIVDNETAGDLRRFGDYTYFVRIGNVTFGN